MNEIGVLFNDAMVRALLTKRKTATRRPVGRVRRVAVGDRLWVREAWCVYGQHRDGPSYEYRATMTRTHPTSWRPSLHMPRAAARILLDVVGVRDEPLQAITEEGARAEGVIVRDGAYFFEGEERRNTAIDAFVWAWNAIYKDTHPWAANPLVRVCEFRVVRIP